MAYKGYLIKVGDYKIPANKFIKADSYSPYVNMQDLDPWTDANGYLHRNAVDLKALKVEFETPAMLTNYDLEEFLSNIRRNYTNLTARECMVEAYIPEYNDYVTQKCYLADFTPQIYSSYGDVLRYNPIRFAFIGGLADD
jgi:hypothetical protein